MAELFDPEKTLPLVRPTPAAFSRYRLITEIGRGGMGIVWRAEDTKLRREIALKFLPELVVRDREAMADLAAETRRCLELTHPHIVRVYDLVEEDGRAAISMEFVDGPSLAERKLGQPDRCFSVDAIGPWIAQLCAALDYAHSKVHIVHRDLKPLNLLVNGQGDLKVVDFGIARSLRTTDARLSLDERARSMSLAYVGPQQLLGEPASVADDIYSLGATIYELLTGKTPFYEGDIPTQLQNIVPPPMSARRAALGVPPREPIPAPWEELVAACLAKKAEARPRTAGEVAARLGLPTGTVTAEIRDIANTATISRSRKAVGWLGVGVIAILGTLGFFVLRPEPASSTATEPPSPTAEAGAAQKTKPDTAAPTPAPVASGPEFIVNVDPPDAGARVWLGRQSDLPVPSDGRLPVKNVRDDEYELTVQAPGYQTYTTRFTARDGVGRTDVKLVPVYGRVVILARAGTVVSAVDARGREKTVGTAPPTGPLMVDNVLTVGTYLFKFSHPECLDAEKPDVVVKTGRPNRIEVAQTAAPGELRVFSVPADADVLVNGTKVGVTPATLSQPAEKPLNVEVYLPGHRRFKKAVRLKPKETLPINAGTLIPESGAIELRIAGLEALARKPTVRVDDRVVNSANGRVTGLDVGERVVEINHPDYQPWKQTVTVRDGQAVPLAVQLVPRPATLNLEVKGPSTYTLKANGKSIPVKQGRATVPAGADIALEVAANGFKTERRKVTLPAKGTQALSFTLVKVAGPEAGRPWTVPEIGLTLMPVAAGSFAMGSEAGEMNERPITKVTLTKPFWLGKTEVTQQEWSALMGSNPAHFKGERLPVESIKWSEAMDYCRKLTERERAADRLPEGYIYTLPTEAQWEYACRAGATGDFAAKPNEMIWHEANSAKTSHPVGTKQPNAWGLHDMLGNVWEWCSDGYADKLHGATTSDPTGARNAVNRVRRGGSFVINAPYLRYSIRGKGEPEYHNVNLGFRVALAPAP